MLRRMTDRVAYKVMLEKLSAKGAGFGSLLLLLMLVVLMFCSGKIIQPLDNIV